MEPVLRAGHGHIEHPPLLLHIHIQHRLLVGRDALIGVQNIDNGKFQTLGAVHGHQRHALASGLPGFRLLFQALLIIFHMPEPFLHRLIARRAFLQLLQSLHKLLGLQAVGKRVFLYKAVKADGPADVTDRGERRHGPQHPEIIAKLFDALHHPSFILIERFHPVPGHDRILQRVTADIAVRTVDDGKNGSTAEVPAGYMNVGQHIFRDPVFVKIRQAVLHRKWNVILHQPLDHQTRIDIGPVQDRDILRPVPGLRIGLDLAGDAQGLLPRVRKRTGHDWASVAAGSREFLLVTLPVITDQPRGGFYDLRRGTVIDAQKHGFRLRVIPGKAQHDLRL